MIVNKISKQSSDFPGKLKNISSPPRNLYVIGDIDPLSDLPVVSVIGSRAMSPYGKSTTTKLVTALASRGIAIVSGLAIGVDALSHQSALDAGGYTVAVLPSPVTEVYPGTNRQLAQQILAQGGALISEYDTDDRSEAFKSRFIERNRLVAGLADALLITEAGEKSGTLHTAGFALDQGKTVMAVPGSINSPTSKGTNNLIKSGATIVTDVNDILDALKISTKTPKTTEVHPANKNEAIIIDLINSGITDSGVMLESCNLKPETFNQTLTMLEITGKIKPLGAGHWTFR